MFTKRELIKLWSNDQKRKAFIQDYKTWGLWFTQPELDLTFYKYDFPDGSRLIAIEYLREPHQYEKTDGSETVICNKYCLQRGAYFTPSAACGYEMTDHLKTLKEKLIKELKQ